MKLKNCSNCGSRFEYKGRHGNRNNNFFCSYECYLAFKTKKIKVKCDWCGKEFMKKRSDIARTKHNYCSHKCTDDYKRWTGLSGKAPVIDGIPAHRVIASEKMGRQLHHYEEVHHIDGNHDNNRIENIVILSKSEHAKIHAAGKERDRFGRFVKAKSDA
ncbi:TPA: HNH endonuclease [Streptococcus pyogenes]|uniref:HNH endonuclease n=1 Tax=Streptococcus pyogenes TaxID=1314 RepID=UPI0007C47535|nr:HNH endonuclease [Streptococcus pyogenes]OAC89375.1 hypothetical protein AWU00_08550 [Streptococcus pyogenes]QCK67760.1 HNH endonuclease [Streptococcus pyogenes]VHF83972.1 Uncharacterised protein [Streptococcus pyogenes]VHM02688.1 Uncharacterised protein [Streptococcus pyogenes]HEQ4429580.1 HNH endonuclease [Streptococcus pyogenes]